MNCNKKLYKQHNKIECKIFLKFKTFVTGLKI